MTLSYYAASLSISLQPASVHVYMAAVKNLHSELGYAYPSGPTTLLARVMRGIQRAPGTRRTRLPITTGLLRQLCQRLATIQGRALQDRLMLSAAFTLAFHGFLRCGELVDLSLDDLIISSDGSAITITLRRSKTDVNGKGTSILVGASPDTGICPVVAVSRYLDIRGRAHGPLFIDCKGCQLTKTALSAELSSLLPLCNVPSSTGYANHSFRIGAATSAAMAGTPEYVIRHMGRWKSDAVLRYIRVSDHEVINVSRQLSSLV